MKSKRFKAALSLLLVLLLILSVSAPAVPAAVVSDQAATGTDDDLPTVSLHAAAGETPGAVISENDVKKVFEDLALGEGDYYGVKQKELPGSPANLSGSSATADVAAGAYTLYRTAVTSSALAKTPDWDAGVSQDVTVRLYFNAAFSVTGCDEGALLLDGEPVSGEVKLYTDTTYTVTAKAVEAFSCFVSGAPEGEAFMPISDMTVTADYIPAAHATVNVNVIGEGTVRILSDGAQVNRYLPVGASFEVEAEPNADRGYHPGSVVVTKDSVALDGPSYGPAGDGDVFELTVTFVFAPEEVAYEVNAASPKLKNADFNTMFGESGSRSYGYASVDNPGSIKALNGSSGTNFSAGEYYIYSAPYNKNNPDWSVAKVKKMTLRTYYTGSFTVVGCADGAVLLNGLEVEGGSARLYTDTDYTVAAKAVDAYFSIMTGAEDGAAFTPSSALTVKVNYYKQAHAVFTLSVNGVGSASVRSDGEITDEYINEGSTFTVETSPNTDRGYKLDTVVVTKGGEEVEAVDGAYGPAADGESYVVTVNFKFEPKEVSYDLHASKKLTSTILNNLFGDSILDMLSKSYGFAPVDTPDQITVATTGGHTVAPGEYYIYRSTSKTNWSAAKVLKLTLKTYYTGSFTVTGHNDGGVLLNDKAVSGKVKLYTGTRYTVAVTPVDGYEYTIEGVEENAAFDPSGDLNVTVTYRKPAFAVFTLNAGQGGTAAVRSGEYTVTEQINDGSTFTVVPSPDTDRGYKLDAVVVTKDGEEVEAVDGVYGPVADGESYVITVSFKFEPNTVRYNLHADKKLTSTILNDLFGDSILDMLSKSYGFAPVDTPDQITVATTGGHTVAPGEYYIYRSSSKSDWSAAHVLRLTLRTYYNGSFTVTGHDAGEILLNGNATTGSVRLYTDTVYTVTVKQIDEYLCTLYGAQDGVAFTPSADVDASAVYVKDKYADVIVNANDGGSVKIISGGYELVDKVPEDFTFAVAVSANASNGYYVESVTVTKNGEAIEAVNGEYGPVLEGEQYAVNVTFAKASLTFTDGEVSLSDIFYENYEAVEEEILKNVTLDPAKFADNAQVKLEYIAYSLLGIGIYEPLTYHGDTGHAFGTSERGGTLKGGNTEKVRVTVALPDYDIELRATAVMTVNEDRVETALQSAKDSFTITYGDDLRAAILDSLSLSLAGDGTPVAFTAEDITVTPDKPNAGLFSAQNAQEITVRYNGSDIYASAETTVSVYVRRAQSSMDADNESIVYGETPEAKVVTTPAGLDHLTVIAGVEGSAEGFVSILIPQSVKERMQIKLAGVVVLDIYQLLSSYIGEDGASVDQLKSLIADINDLIESSDTVKQAIGNSGFDVEALGRILNFISGLPTIGSNLRLRLDQIPKNAGTYMMFAVSTDTNYTLSESLSYIVIRPKATTQDETVALRFKDEMPSSGIRSALSYDEAQSFDFGGELYVNDAPIAVDSLRTLYVGTTLRGAVVSQSEPATEPGVYTETVFLLGGNYLATPIVREYSIDRVDTRLIMEDLTVTYDGAAHEITVHPQDSEELTDSISVLYVGTGYLSSRAPVNAGEYMAYATYAGDQYHKADTASARLIIEKREAVITVSCKETFTYGEIDRSSTSAANVRYTVSGTVNDDRLGVIVATLNLGDNFPNVGEYTATARIVQTNDNYRVTIEDATLTIVPKRVIVRIDDVQKYIGSPDPAFTYTVTDAQGKTLGTKPEATLEREEGEAVGTYRIYVAQLSDSNYVLDEEASVEGVLTINDTPILLGDVDGDGKVDVFDAAAIQKSAAGVSGYTDYAQLDQNDLRLKIADIDRDGKVDIFDASLIQNWIAGSASASVYGIGEPIAP